MERQGKDPEISAQCYVLVQAFTAIRPIRFPVEALPKD